MNIVVLIAGVHDPKWPITPNSALSDTGEHRIMSPFDEAALEMALRLRDADPAVQIAVRVAGGEAAQRIARTVAALNIAEVATLAIDRAWDQSATAGALAPWAAEADLILIGREFGDFDDGLVPALLAAMLGVPFFGRAQTVSVQTVSGQTVSGQGGAVLLREAGPYAETLALSGRLLASVTNDRRTRLRKPLMKNVMQARQAVIGESIAVGRPTTALALSQLEPRTAGRGHTNCERLSGPVEQQAQALADLLWEARA